MNDMKKQNRFFGFLKNMWLQTRLCVKSFLVVILIAILSAVMLYVTTYLYISSGGLNSFAEASMAYVHLGTYGLLLFLFLWALICLVVSVINLKKPGNIVFSILGTILVFVVFNLCAGITVSEFFGQRDKEMLRYFAYNMQNLKKLNKFSQEIQSLRTDEKFIFTEQSVNELSEKLSPHESSEEKHFLYYPYFDFNKNLFGLNPSKIPADVVVLFQSENDKSSFSDSNNISAKWHFDRGSLIIFGDGRLDFIKKEDFKKLRWKP